MNQEQLIKAKQIEAAIKAINENITEAKRYVPGPYGQGQSYIDAGLCINSKNRHNPLFLLPSILPITFESFRDLYVMNGEKKIQELEAEFEAL